MFIASNYFLSLIPLLGLALFGWLMSLKNNNVTIVDSLWAQFFLLATISNFLLTTVEHERAILIFILVSAWSIRLSIYLHFRNHKKPEDLRYQAIRARNEPNFRMKSLYLVFIFQAVLAWIISLPLHVSINSINNLNLFDHIGVGLWIIGMLFQTIGDAQLAKFKSDPANKGSVLSTGLWRYTRHPNYFGESCIWLGYGLIAVGAGAWWTMLTPIFMTYLLVKVTGAKLLESDIANRRPDYKKYVLSTASFFPWFPKG